MRPARQGPVGGLPRAVAATIQVAVAVVIAAALGPSTPSHAARHPAGPACEAARYLVAGDPLVTASGVTADALELSAARATIGDACPAVRPATFRATRKGTTKVAAVWRSCRGLAGKVKLKGEIVEGCGRLVASVKARRYRRAVDAARSRCGDGRRDAGNGEECEPPGTAACDARCRAVTPVSAVTTTTTSTTTTTAARPLDVWRPATVPYDPTCARGCDEVEHTDRLPHVGGDVRFLHDPAVDDPIAQWGDCLASMLRCLRGHAGVRACAASAACPDACKTLFVTRAAAGGDELALLAILNGVYVDPGAPCRPADAGAP